LEKNETPAEVPYTLEEMAQLEARLESVKLSPRDVYRKTLAEGLAYGQEKKTPIRPYVTLYLQQDWLASYNSPAVYYVEYVTDAEGITLIVNPQTGMVVDRRALGSPQPTATPRP
jgi:hypothetical protein